LVGRLTSYSESFIEYNLARLGQAREYFICLYLGMVEELEAGGQGDILGVPPAEIQDDNAGISSVFLSNYKPSKTFFSQYLGA